MYASAGDSSSQPLFTIPNLTPLIDVALTVLFVYMVSSELVARTSIPVDLPVAQSAEPSQLGLLNLTVDGEGQLFINGEPGTLADIPAAVERLRAVTPPGRPVTAFVSADISARYGAFAAVLDRLRLARVTDIALDTQPLEAEGT